MGRKLEREDIVKYLRDRADSCDDHRKESSVSYELREAANDIEKGEY